MPFQSRSRRVLTACLVLLAVAACSARPFVVGAPKALAPSLANPLDASQIWGT